MAINARAATDSRHARTGKDAAIYDGDGNMIASVDSFQAQTNFSNAKYQPLGDWQEYESASTFGISITMSQIVIEDDTFISDVLAYMNDGITPNWKFQGTLTGLNGSEERIVYPQCIPSGNWDLQNFTTGDVIKRQMSMFCNGKPEKTSDLTIE